MKLLATSSNILTCQIITGSHCGETVHIPRIALCPSDDQLPCKIKRVQFPVKLAFAMTINKSQGQSLDRVGLDLQSPVFSHGQLYVALSRVTNPENLNVLLETPQSTTTKNVVFREIFDLLR